jgi:hypothetical protein
VLRRPVEFALHTPVGVVHELIADAVTPGVDRHLQRIQRQARPQVISDLPADDLAGKQVRDERGVHKPAGGGHIGDVSDPPAVRCRRGEVPFQQVRWPPQASTGHCGTWLLPRRGCPGDAQRAHQPLHRAPGHLDAFTPQLPPYFPCPIQPAAFPPVLPHAHDLLLQLLVPDRTRRRLAFTLLSRVISGDREFQDRAHRLDTEPATM